MSKGDEEMNGPKQDYEGVIKSLEEENSSLQEKNKRLHEENNRLTLEKIKYKGAFEAMYEKVKRNE